MNEPEGIRPITWSLAPWRASSTRCEISDIHYPLIGGPASATKKQVLKPRSKVSGSIPATPCFYSGLAPAYGLYRTHDGVGQRGREQRQNDGRAPGKQRARYPAQVLRANAGTEGNPEQGDGCQRQEECAQ